MTRADRRTLQVTPDGTLRLYNDANALQPPRPGPNYSGRSLAIHTYDVVEPPPPELCTGYDTDWALASQGAVWSTEPDPQYPDPWPNFPVEFDDPEKAAYDVAGETGVGGFACFLAGLWVSLDVDLGAVRVVNRITFDQTYNAWTRIVQTSNDGVAYTTLLPEFTLTSDPMAVDLDAPVESRYWRFLHHWINDDGGGHWKYVGIQSYEYIALLGCP